MHTMLCMHTMFMLMFMYMVMFMFLCLCCAIIGSSLGHHWVSVGSSFGSVLGHRWISIGSSWVIIDAYMYSHFFIKKFMIHSIVPQDKH